MDIWKAFAKVISVVIILDGINLLTNKSKMLVKLSMKKSAFCNSDTRRAIVRNHDKTAKVLGIQYTIGGILLLIFSIIYNNTEFTGNFLIMGILSLFNLFILGFVVPSIK
ncbi:hypothetical protein LL037_17860 [Clostridium estertheticum]|uniref:DUF3784 domain-containing protein n=1 Tax=Clostridium estertheticum TaxID=238834 RepID=A0AA47EJU7_9CLOT|nr:hypothetical protein [Clostridium estertheticum]MBU3153665.1 hypothetical protein [Clostridium estertheticum]MBU3202456.1 hypothetical protein [Clostridium estertheticum]WAG61547.1 hypothetical protein LL038_04665 [Clostridium estertheticum]WAG64325.1 hypothetical protein LL037_17860 [Clostridium estertheticum]